MARSRRRNGWCEFSALLLSHRPPPDVGVAELLHGGRYDRRRSVTIIEAAVALHQALHQLQGCPAIPGLGR